VNLLFRVPGVAIAVLVTMLALSSYCAADGPVQIDIKPGECPNVLSLSSLSHLSVAVFGSPTFNVLDVDLASVRLSRVDGFGGTIIDDGLGSTIADPLPIGSVAPIVQLSHFTVLPTSYQKQDEVGNCQIAANDSSLALVLQFYIPDVFQALALDSFPGGAIVPLMVTGNLQSGGSFPSSKALKAPDFLKALDFVTLVSLSAPVVTILPSNDTTLTAPNTAINLTTMVSGKPKTLSSFQWCKEKGVSEKSRSKTQRKSPASQVSISPENT